jgi:hypothetical protein
MIDIKGQHGFNYIRQIYWADVKADIKKINPELAKIIDEISPDKNLPLIKAGYAFGDKIVANGKFLLLEHAKNQTDIFPAQEQKKLLDYFSYAPLPLGVLLNKAAEVFIELNNRIIPVCILDPGSPIGTFEVLDSLYNVRNDYIWQTTAGARSLFMLSKINNNIGHKKLKKEFALDQPAPKAIPNHWDTFVAITKHNTNWQCELLFFTNEWYNQLKQNSPGWIKLREFLLKDYWNKSNAIVEKTFAIIWQHFSTLTIQRRFKPRIYITDTIRHLINLACGSIPGFKPATNELLAPIKLLKKAYVDVYNLNQHAPTILEPCSLTPDNPTIYYSLGYPTLLEGHPETANINNTITLLKEIQLLMTNMFEYSKRGMAGAEQFVKFIQQTDFAYFHKTPDIYGEVKSAEQINQEDPNFTETENFPNNQHFCSTGPFLNGCIRIRRQFT